MNCDNCKQAQTVKHWAMFQADCDGCKVRAVASGPRFFDAIRANCVTPAYRDVLQANFGSDGWRAAHERVKKEHKRLKEMK